MIAERYEMGEVIGTGGMGVVRAGRDSKLDRAVAIKFLRSDLAEQPDLRARFEAEARAAARISHPNVVGVFDTGEHEGVPYIVMELLSGRSLAEELEAGPLDPHRVRRIGLEILSALEAFHREGILHRDLKPDNVLMAADGTVKVGDFGVAKITEGMDLTMAGTMLGTPAYLAPERVAGEPASAASDVYSVGVVLYELLTGSTPYAGDSTLAMLRAIQYDEPTPLSQVRPDVERPLAEAIEKAMAKDPAHRYAHASSMAADLGVETSMEALEATQVIEVAGASTQVVSVPVQVPLPDPRFSPAPTPTPALGVAATASSAPPEAKTNVQMKTAVVPPVRKAAALRSWEGLSTRRKLGAAIGAAVILIFLGSLVLSDPAPPAAPGAETPQESTGAPAASLEDALNRLEEGVQP